MLRAYLVEVESLAVSNSFAFIPIKEEFMKNLIPLLVIFSLFITSNALAEVIGKEGLCRTFRLSDKMYTMSYSYDLHGGDYLEMKMYRNAGLAHGFHGNPPVILADALLNFGMERIKILPSGTKSCDQEVKIVQSNDSDGNQMDIRLSFSGETNVDGHAYYPGQFESFNIDGLPLPQIYRQLVCNKRAIDSIKSVLISKCSDAEALSSDTHGSQNKRQQGIQ